MRKIMCVLLIFILVTSTLFAGVGDFFRGDSGIFKLDPVYDGIIGGGGILINAGVLVWDHFNGKPHFDGKILDINTVNPFDRWAAQPYSEPLHITGTVTESLAIAFPAVLFAANMSEWGVWATMYAESVLWANGLKEVMKTAVVRERPYMYFEGYPEDKVNDKSGDFARSFPSGHTTMAFNGAVFASYVFSKYFPDSPWKIPVIAGSLSLATGTAILRVMSGNHFLSDVLTGAVLGSVTGFLVPFLHTLPKNDKIQPVVTPTGFIVRYQY